MTFKFTLRRNGRQMTTITGGAHHLGGRQVMRILCRFQTAYVPDVDGPDPFEDDQPGDDLTKGQVERTVRRALHEYGQDAYASEDEGWAENLVGDDPWVVVQWAARQVEKHFPALIDDDYRAYVHEWKPSNKYRCPSCGGLVDRHDLAYVCRSCGDEWTVEEIEGDSDNSAA